MMVNFDSIMDLLAANSVWVVGLVILIVLNLLGKITKFILRFGLIACGIYFIYINYGNVILDFLSPILSFLK